MTENPDFMLQRESQTLTKAEGSIVRTYRKVLLGKKDCPSVVRDFRTLFGGDAQEVYVTFCTLLCALAYAARRPLGVGHPGCHWLTGDERQLLALIAAIQAEDAALFEAHVRWLARAELRGPLTIALHAFAGALLAHGQSLPREKTAGRIEDADAALPLRVVAG